MRLSVLSFLLVAFPLVAAAPACGGKTLGEPGPPSSPGGSSSGSGSASSSGGVSTGSSSSSSGGSPGECPGGMIPSGSACSTPDLACSYCDEITEIHCTCTGGQWACLDDGPACPPPPCPDSPPQVGSGCGPIQYSCSWGTMEGCGGETCSCEGTWSCAPTSCPPPPPCPADAPQPMSICSSVGQTCTYSSACQDDEQCECDPSGTWGCAIGGCPVDAGAPTADAQ